MFRKIKRYLKNPYWEFGNVLIKHCPKLMPDKYYLSVLYYKWYGKKIDWENPRTFNEKLQWLKLYDRNPLYPTLVDKYEVKKWVSDKIGEQYVIPTLGLWKHFDEIDFDELPNQFVLKCTHDSGSVVICNDKATFDKNAAKAKLESALKKNFYWWAREWPYKKVKHRIIAEPLLAEPKNLNEFKFYCFNGVPKFFQSITDRYVEKGGPILINYGIDCKRIDMKDAEYKCRQDVDFDIFPRDINKMLEISSNLSMGKCCLRVDFYETDSRLYVGEMTFYESGGFCTFTPDKYNYELGDWMILPK